MVEESAGRSVTERAVAAIGFDDPRRLGKIRFPMKSIARLLLAALALATLHAADPSSFAVGSFNFKRPAALAWVAVDPAGMRKAQLYAGDPKDPAKRAEIVFFHFGAGVGGGVDANIQRWLGQFTPGEKDPKPIVEKAEVKGTKLTRVRAEGTFASGMPGGPTTPQPNSALLGVILESPNGDVFVKMTGPGDVVKANAQNFEDLIKSALE